MSSSSEEVTSTPSPALKRAKPTPTPTQQRYRCRYGCPSHSSKTGGIGFTAPNLRKHMKHKHRIFNEAEAPHLVQCQWCTRWTIPHDKEISCNKVKICKATEEQMRNAMVPWPKTEQEFAKLLLTRRGLGRSHRVTMFVFMKGMMRTCFGIDWLRGWRRRGRWYG